MAKPIITQIPSESSRALLQGLWEHMSPRRQIQFGLLLLVMFVCGGAELVSLGAVLPFLTFLSDPEQMWQQPLVQVLASRVGFKQPTEILLPLSFAFAAAALLAALARLTNLWLNGRFAAAVGTDLSCEVYRRTLYQPYGVHVQLNSSEVIAGTSSQVDLTVKAFEALLHLITSTVVATALLTGLLLINAQVAVSAAVFFGSTYGLLVISLSRKLRKNGQRMSEASIQQIKALQEPLGAIRDVLLSGSQLNYLKIYQEADRPQRQLQASNNFMAGSPRYAFEALSLLAIALLGGLLTLQTDSSTAVIPLLGSLAFGAQRLLPALQQIYKSWVTLKSYNRAMQVVLNMLQQPLPHVINMVEPLLFSDAISLEGVTFRYQPEQPDVVCEVDLVIRRGERVGLVGSTGSGKSTVVDLMMGLLIPSSGKILIDGENLHDLAHPERLAAWWAAIACVPQSIYLADCSVAENIAFGLPSEKIDMARVQQAAWQAQIGSFIESSPEGYQSFVGERGIRLSGGQRQRIGIARALYKQAQILVFDEATSALDSCTEDALMDSVNKLSKELTVVMIAHRLSTVRACDRVVRLDRGSVVANGPPSLILDSNSW